MKHSRIQEKLKNIDGHFNHPPYVLEQKLLSEIKLGLKDDAMQTLHELNKLERPFLAQDSLRSFKNSLMISCAIYTRAAIDAGIHPEDAFEQSDVFIRHIEHTDSKKSLLEFEYEMLEQFILLVRMLNKNTYPYPINHVINYIKSNAASKLSVKELADFYHLSPDYLSRLFTKEVGITLTTYIQQEKIKLAKHFLENKEMSITDIATLLEFSNPGHFSNQFKKHAGITPRAYKKKYHA